MNLDKVKETDAELAQFIEEELHRQENTIELIASENFTSPAVMQACGSVLTWIRLKNWLKKEHVNYSRWIMRMFNHIPARKQTWLYFLHYLNMAIQS